jgi:hypothetical protein
VTGKAKLVSYISYALNFRQHTAYPEKACEQGKGVNGGSNAIMTQAKEIYCAMIYMADLKQGHFNCKFLLLGNQEKAG